MNRLSADRSGRVLLSILIAGAALAARPTLAAKPTVDPDAEAKALVQLDDDWAKAAARRDVDRVTSFYAEDAIAYPPSQPMAIGKAAARKVWADYLCDSSFTISWKTAHSGVAKSGDLGFTTGTYEDSYKGPDGKMVNETGKYVCIWKKQADGSWKAIHDTWNTDSK